MRFGCRNLLVLMGVLVAFAVAGCSSSSDDGASSTTGPTSSAVPTTDRANGAATITSMASGTSTGDVDGFCSTARRISEEAGDDPLEVDGLRDRPGRFEAFRDGVITLDGHLQTMVGQAPAAIRSDLETFADAVHGFAAGAQHADSADALIAQAPDFDSGALGRAGDRLENFIGDTCRVDVDLD